LSPNNRNPDENQEEDNYYFIFILPDFRQDSIFTNLHNCFSRNIKAFFKKREGGIKMRKTKIGIKWLKGADRKMNELREKVSGAKRVRAKKLRKFNGMQLN